MTIFNRAIAMALCLAFILLLPGAAQEQTIPVTLPIHGKLAFVVPKITAEQKAALYIVDTYTGDIVQFATDDILLSSLAWNNTGEMIAYTKGNTTVTHNFSNSPENLISTTGAFPLSWSPDNQYLLYEDVEFNPSRSILGIIDVTTGTSQVLFEYQDHEQIADIPLPSGIEQLEFDDFGDVSWNPIYEDWIAIQINGSNATITDSEGNSLYVEITFMYNVQSGEMLSIDSLFSERLSPLTPLKWHPDGKYLLVSLNDDDNTTVVIAFEQHGEIWQLRIAKQLPFNGNYIGDWLGASDLLLTSNIDPMTNDLIYSISQTFEDNWYSQEFFRLPATVFPRISQQQWIMTADETERRALSCLFDQTLPSRLQVNTQGQVTFTDGTPGRLRREPGRDAEIITQIPEGSTFDVIGEPWCADGYHWWQIQLTDGTIGYASEASTDEYFLEPVDE